MKNNVFVICVLSICMSGECMLAQTTVKRDFSYENFDGAQVDITLNINQSFLDASLVNWFELLTNPKADPKANYFDLVEAHFNKNEEPLKFVFDVFDKALPNVSDAYFINTIIRFVQSMPYKIPPSDYKNTKTGGILAPALSLEEGWGDCDTKSILLMCILGHRYELLFLAGVSHAFIGIRAEPGVSQEYVEIEGKKYVLCEMTSKWKLGQLPASSVKDINSGKYNYRVFKY